MSGCPHQQVSFLCIWVYRVYCAVYWGTVHLLDQLDVKERYSDSPLLFTKRLILEGEMIGNQLSAKSK